MGIPWTARIAEQSGPKYLRIARAIEASIAAGELAAGDQLPPQRELADALGVTVGTVARAYQVATEAGRVGGHVGRGTFVARAGAGAPAAETFDLTLNQPLARVVDDAVVAALGELAREREARDLLLYRREESREHQEAAAAWLARSGVAPAPGEVLVTAGGQHGLLLALLALCAPGDAVLTERLTHPGFVALARQLRLRLVGVRSDGEGVDPEHLAAQARASGARVACFTPVLHNPTALTWSAGRFAAVARLAGELGLWVVEDDVYRPLVADAPPALHARGVDGVLVASISKALTGGLRVGAVTASEPLLTRLRSGVAASLVMVSPLAVELASRLVQSRRLDAWLRAQREAIAARQATLDRHLPPDARLSPRAALHAWVAVPRGWSAQELFAALARAGVLVSPCEAFAVQPDDVDAAFRVSLGGALGDGAFEAAAERLGEVLRRPPPGGPLV